MNANLAQRQNLEDQRSSIEAELSSCDPSRRAALAEASEQITRQIDDIGKP